MCVANVKSAPDAALVSTSYMSTRSSLGDEANVCTRRLGGREIAVFFALRDGFQVKPALPLKSAWMMVPCPESIAIWLWQGETKARSANPCGSASAEKYAI